MRMASCGLSPMMMGKTNVAPNIATTCCAPSPTVRGQDSRSSGRTTAPGGGVLPPCTTRHPTTAMTHTAFHVEVAPRMRGQAGYLMGKSSPTCGTRVGRLSQPAHLEYPQREREVQTQGRRAHERADGTFELGDPVPQGVVVEVQPARGLGDVAVGVQEY